MSNQNVTAAEAAKLLSQADQAAATANAGSSWPAIALLMTIGASSSISLVAYAFAPSNLIWLPITVQMCWMGLAFLICLPRLLSVKRGFGRRWGISIAAWTVAWVFFMYGTGTWFVGQTWFLLTGALVLTAITAAGAFVESRR